MKIHWNKTSEGTSPNDSNENIHFITESMVVLAGWYDNGKFVDSDNDIEYSYIDVMYWIKTNSLIPEEFHEEQEHRTNAGLNH
jgi:hypothetical protein